MSLQIVLDRPLIPQNTGSIARSCAATGAELHLIGPLGFEITEKQVRRAGLDYWPLVKLYQHTSFEEYLEAARPENIWLIETCGKKNYSQASLGKNDAFIFGQETKGIDPKLLQRFDSDRILNVPILCNGVRSLNLSNCVSVVLYEALRQNNFEL